MGELEVAAGVHRGTKIGRYQVLTQLTQGGMAELFLGYTAGPGGFRKYVVIKRILPDAKNNDQFEKMFLDEARVTAAFSHPNIAQVFELGQEENDLYLRRMMARADWTVVAWGRGVPGMAHRILEVVTLAHDLEEPLLCLGTTHAGDPLHPLRLRADTQPRLWAADPRLTRAGFVLS